MGSVQTSEDISLDPGSRSNFRVSGLSTDNDILKQLTEQKKQRNQRLQQQSSYHPDRTILKELFAAAEIPFSETTLWDGDQLSKMLQSEFVKNITQSSIILKDEHFSFGEKNSICAPLSIAMSFDFSTVSIWMDEYFKKPDRIQHDVDDDPGNEVGRRLTTFFEELSKFVLNGIQTGELLKVNYANTNVFENTIRYQLYEKLKKQYVKIKYKDEKSENPEKIPVSNTHKVVPYLTKEARCYFQSVSGLSTNEKTKAYEALKLNIFKERGYSNHLNSLLALSGDGKNILCFKQDEKSEPKDPLASKNKTHRVDNRSKTTHNTYFDGENDWIRKNANKSKGNHGDDDDYENESIDNLVYDTYTLKTLPNLNINFILDEMVVRSVSSEKSFDVTVSFKNFAKSLSDKLQTHNMNVLESKFKKEQALGATGDVSDVVFNETLQTYDDFLIKESDFYSNLAKTAEDVIRMDDILTKQISEESTDPKSVDFENGAKKSCLYNVFSNDSKFFGSFDFASPLKLDTSKNIKIVPASMFALNKQIKENVSDRSQIRIYKKDRNIPGSDIVLSINDVRYASCDHESKTFFDFELDFGDLYFLKEPSKAVRGFKERYENALKNDPYVEARRTSRKKMACFFNSDFENIPRVLYTESKQSALCKGRHIHNLNINASEMTDCTKEADVRLGSNVYTFDEDLEKISETIVNAILKNYKLFFDTDVVPTLYQSNMLELKEKPTGMKRAKYIQIGYLQYDKKNDYISLVIQSKKRENVSNLQKEDVYEIKNIVAIRSDICESIEKHVLSKKYDDLEVLNYDKFEIELSVRYLESSLVPFFKKEMIKNILNRTFTTFETHSALCVDRVRHCSSTSSHGTEKTIKDDDVAIDLEDRCCASNEDSTMSEVLVRSVLDSEFKMQNDRMQKSCENVLRELFSNVKVDVFLEFFGWLYNDFNPSLNDE